MEIQDIVRVGIVTDVNKPKMKARVRFEDVDMTSAWLNVMYRLPIIAKGANTTENASGGAGDAAYASHKHDIVIEPWMPKVNDKVICLYIPVFNGDGYILGGIK